jgi:ribosomal protein S18 acetylase RimI-like enzyme
MNMSSPAYRGREFSDNRKVSIRPFRFGDESAFRKLNERWISQYFKVEEADEKVFSDPVGTILHPGGQILFAEMGGIADREFEVAKMAVDPEFQGKGIGRSLLRAVVDAGREMGARRLYLETNHQLGPAIHLYEELGFRHVPAQRVHASPYARADVFMELFLE